MTTDARPITGDGSAAGPDAVGQSGQAQDSDDAEVQVDFGTALGVSLDLSPQVLRLYIPNKDRQSREFGTQRKWVLEAAHLLSKIGGGVTMLPPAEGGWVDEENDRTVWESPILIYTYVKPDLFQKHLPDLREFLHRLGRETNQGEVALEFDGDFYRIRKFDPPQPGA
ncbi:MAG TPA: hypothetical protein VGY53_06705 [Isosphaeraceae bacterium]|nr:hypothetical protein [Isosphaeraceae bacterium]